MTLRQQKSMIADQLHAIGDDIDTGGDILTKRDYDVIILQLQEITYQIRKWYEEC